MRVVETEAEFQIFKDLFETSRSLVIPIFQSPTRHPATNALSLLYVAFETQSFILPFYHADAEFATPELHTEQVVATPDKKALLHVFPHLPKIVDLYGLEYFHTHKVTTLDTFFPSAIRQYLNLYRDVPRVNCAIPLMRWVEVCEAYKTHAAQWTDAPSGFEFHNNVLIPATKFIEESGIHVDASLFLRQFGAKALPYIISDMVYTEYNPYTAAGRVSNRYGGVNYAALNTSDGTRRCFRSRFPRGAMVSLDFESFHLRLIAELIGFTLPREPVHEFLAKSYFKTLSPTPEQYQAGKQKTFSLLYGGDRSTDIEFFQRVYAFQDNLWETVQKTGGIQSSSGRLIRLDMIDSPSKSKIFNYYLQLYETEVAMHAIYALIPVFKAAQSKLVLYTYDSILIDYALGDGRALLDTVISTLEQDGKFPVRVYCGPTYDELQNVTSKVKSS